MLPTPFNNQDLEAVTDHTTNSQQILPMENQQSSIHVMKPNYDKIPERVTSSDHNTLADPKLQKLTMRKLMKTDEKFW